MLFTHEDAESADAETPLSTERDFILPHDSNIDGALNGKMFCSPWSRPRICVPIVLMRLKRIVACVLQLNLI